MGRICSTAPLLLFRARNGGVDEVAQSLIASGKIEPLIIVGIYNAGVERVNEYTAAQDPKYKAGGKADLYEWYI